MVNLVIDFIILNHIYPPGINPTGLFFNLLFANILYRIFTSIFMSKSGVWLSLLYSICEIFKNNVILASCKEFENLPSFSHDLK